MEFNKKYGSWAVIAGSADGLGRAYSKALAARNMNLIMVDRQQQMQDKLALELETVYGIKTLRLNLDLSTSQAVPEIMTQVKNTACRMLVYNAAYSLIKPFTEQTEQDLDMLIEVNTRTPIKLVHAFVRHLSESSTQYNPRGGVLLMSSLSGLLGMQLVAPYAASKAFNWNLAESLYHELKPSNIDVMGCVAGIMSTPAYLDSKPQYGMFKPYIMQPAYVANAALDKMGKKNLFIPGFRNRLNYFILTRLICRKWASWMANRVMADLYRDRLPGS